MLYMLYILYIIIHTNTYICIHIHTCIYIYIHIIYINTYILYIQNQFTQKLGNNKKIIPAEKKKRYVKKSRFKIY